jgi:GxxExxY protein
MNDLLHREVSEEVIKAFYHVYNTLGYGFLEKVYENALALALRKRGFEAVQQMPVKVEYSWESTSLILW